jgi:hypothetical protein
VVAALLLAAPAVVPWRVVAQKAEVLAEVKTKGNTNQPPQVAKPLTAEEKFELGQKLAMAEEQARLAANGDQMEALEKWREASRLRRKIAFANRDLNGVKTALASEIGQTEQLRSIAADHIALGVGSVEMRDKYAAEAKELRKQLVAYGRNLPSSGRRIPVTRDGVIVSVLKKRGDQVSKNDEILRLDDEEAQIKMRTARSELEIAEADFKLQTIDIQTRMDLLKEKRSLSIEDNAAKEKGELQLRKARAQLAIAEQKLQQTQLEVRAYTIRAPQNGFMVTVPGVGTRIGPSISAVEYVPEED